MAINFKTTLSAYLRAHSIKPGNPDQPDIPDDPDKPDIPDNPDIPVEPEIPAEPEKVEDLIYFPPHSGTTEIGREEQEIESDIITDDSIASKSKQGVFETSDGEGYQIATVEAVEDGEAQIISFPINAKVTGIKNWSSLMNTWTWLGGSKEASMSNDYFIPSGTHEEQVNDNTITYQEYSWNVDVYDIIGAGNYRFYIEI